MRARRLSRVTLRIIKENLFFAVVYDALGVPIATRRALPRLWLAAEPDDRCSRDELQFGFRRRESPPPPSSGGVRGCGRDLSLILRGEVRKLDDLASVFPRESDR